MKSKVYDINDFSIFLDGIICECNRVLQDQKSGDSERSLARDWVRFFEEAALAVLMFRDAMQATGAAEYGKFAKNI